MTDPMREPERILVVDDEEVIRRLMGRMVAEAGHAVETAGGAAEARERLAVDTFALVICDLNMPGESGRDLVRWIREELPDVAVLIASGSDDREIADAVLALGAYGYLLKPFRHNEMAINIDNALRRRRLEIENREHRQQLERRVDERTSALREAVWRLESSQRELQRAHETTIQRLSLAIEFRSHEAGVHVQRIGENAGLLGRRVGLDGRRCEMLRVAAALHDVGKIAIPDAILLKPGRLTDVERHEMETHAAVGQRLLSGSGNELLELAADIAWTHHERFDGSGYPRGLSGEEIPIEGRITAVTDVFDSLTHDRVYREALEPDEALDMMQRGEAGALDPVLLGTFGSLVGDLVAIEDGAVEPTPRIP